MEEDLVRAAAHDGVRAMVIRPGIIWGSGDHTYVSMVHESVARTGSACYVGEKLNVYSHVHIDDVTRLYAAALADGQARRLFHAVGGETPISTGCHWPRS